MGQEIDSHEFTEADFTRFAERLRHETDLAIEWFRDGRFSDAPPTAGFEIEAWLVDADMRPAAANIEFLQRLDNPLATEELARFNVELNNHPHALSGDVLSAMKRELDGIWREACAAAESMGIEILLTGILPTLTDADLGVHNMSPRNRYVALNEQVLRGREGRPLHLDIVGHEHLHSEHASVMLESAATSFQIHMQVPAGHAHHLYNASIIASAPMIAASANAPYLFGHDLWDETRIPLFEQAVEVGGYAGAAHGPLRRVSFGSGFARHSIMECFEENLQHFPVLLPMTFEDAATLDHLRLHNGTIWRWNRPLIGFDAGGLPHIRIEHRVVPAGPTLEDSLANAAFFYGLAESLAQELRSHDGIRAGVPPISFAQAKDNFYQAARHGLKAVLTWRDERRTGVRELLLEQLLPRSREGLRDLGVTGGDIDHYLGIMRARVESGQNGCTWQRRWVEAHGRDMTALTAAYRDRQQTDVPVHEWYV